ncbi:NarK/NasA family nitrate transporter [Geobacter hydrogenophilus]|uniref:Nitrite extrusion protein n=2 Tax=Geobacter hydrogenophilus TaxID=40983 RepID=A0A9W6G0Y3_9BACT|nr:nitrate/nitrite transporter [Geobacter hydrogenophilus]MBT0894340.1 NarK/NasA family nitrate transporter [Geobacter hydrogenophilus]GLI38373.1 nitrite extrusion protein [Geobacter hydrogenophilus]
MERHEHETATAATWGTQVRTRAMATHRHKQLSVLTMNTFAFTVCFAVWVMFSIIGIPIKAALGLNETQFGILAATPILSGSLIRLPLGMWTDKYGGRIVFFILMLCTIVPIYLVSAATAYWHFLLLGLFIGLAGGAFSVGISYTARWFTKQRQGFAMGIFGAGNAGAAVTKFLAPSLVVAYGWQMVPKVYAAAMLVTAILFWAFTFSEHSHKVSTSVTIRDQLAALKDPKVWRYCQYYAIVFGGYVGLSLWMTKYYINEYGFDIRTAALVAAIFVLPSGVIRALGGWLSDRFGAHTVTCWVMWISGGCLLLLSIPHFDVVVTTVNGPVSRHVGLNVWVFTSLLFVVGIAWGFGKASVFKHISDEYPHNIGVISGIVGLIGGLGGFLLPIMFGALVDLTGVRSTAFMLLYGSTCVSLFWMYLALKKEKVHHKLKTADILE